MKKIAFKKRVQDVFNKGKCDVTSFGGWCQLVTKSVSDHLKIPQNKLEKIVEKEMMAELYAGNLNRGESCCDFDDILKRMQIAIVHEA